MDGESSGGLPWVTIGTLLVALGAVLVSLAPSLLGGEVFLGSNQLTRFAPWSAEAPLGTDAPSAPLSDTYDFYHPQKELAADAFWDGDLALWNPFGGGGSPLAAIPDAGVFGPLDLPYLLLPEEHAPVATKTLELLCAIGFSILFLRRHRLSYAAATVGGLVFAFSGFQIAWTNWQHTRAAAFIPALFWVIDRLATDRRRRDVGILGLVVGAMLLEGFPAVLLFSAFTGGAYACGRAWFAAEHGGRVRALLATSVSAGLGVILGVGVASFQLIPFLDRLSAFEVTEARGSGNSPTVDIATTIFPGVFGRMYDGVYFGPSNFVEGLAFVGTGAALLALIALTTDRKLARFPRLFFATASIAWLGVVFFDSPAERLLASLPGFDSNHLGRARSIIGFAVAVMAAFGVQALMARSPSSPDPSDDDERPWYGEPAKRLRSGLSVVGFARLGAVLAAGAAAFWAATIAVDRARDFDRAEYAVTEIRSDLRYVAAIFVLLVVVRARSSLAPFAPLVVVGVVAVQAVSLAAPYWPDVSSDEHFIETATHEFLEAEAVGDRIVSFDGALLPGSTTYYDIRTVTGHVFYDPAWAEILEEVQPGAFARSRTNPKLVGGQSQLDSPLLDRLGARYAVVREGADLVGRRVPGVVATTSTSVTPDQPATGEIPGGRVRGVAVTFTEVFTTSDPLAYLVLTVRDSAGNVVAEETDRLGGAHPARRRDIAVPLDGSESGPLTVTVSLDADDGTLELASASDGGLSLESVIAEDDHEIVFTDGSIIYRRAGALPRFRWASETLIVETVEDRPAVLNRGVAPDTVVLESPPTQPADGLPAEIVVERDGLDELQVSIDAAGAGYLVVADALQYGWEVTVDGEAADLVPADHALVAVAVPAGRHTIRFSFEPAGWPFAPMVSLSSVAAALALVATDRRRRGAAVA